MNNYTNVHKIFNQHRYESQVVTKDNSQLKFIIDKIKNEKIIKADSFPKGSQMKFLLTLSSGIKVIMKPKRYSRNDIFTGYTGADRFNSEIVTFYLNRILGFNKSPLTTGRLINLTQLQLVSSSTVKKTFFQSEDGTKLCFYGICSYCKKSESICLDPQKELLETSLSMVLPKEIKLTNYYNPWMRSYKKNHVAWWEYESNYCLVIQTNNHETNKFNERRNLLNLIDSSILDFLVGNSDRHHVEFLSSSANASSYPDVESQSNRKENGEEQQSFIVLLDNGKGFGTYFEDDISILAPLYQCCILKKETWKTIIELSSLVLVAATAPTAENYRSTRHLQNNSNTTFGTLVKTIVSEWERDMPDLLLPEYYSALDRRILKIVAAGHYCLALNLWKRYGRRSYLEVVQKTPSLHDGGGGHADEFSYYANNNNGNQRFHQKADDYENYKKMFWDEDDNSSSKRNHRHKITENEFKEVYEETFI